ncbi:PIN domain-containing protein [Exiguobacterium undae]|uniref:PIN like domain-containing protein n=1 Tax=Exiguobacterium undae TaxID=169177 RepID=A0ABX2V607_9BACL|nr:PIN domain-containing protein [Exiguobacterium undae]OAN10145.1 hypothetical protein A3783_15390 [Exiguobacterium undae]
MPELISFENFNTFWDEDPIVIIDSCSLLDLYRYAPNASKRILNNLKEIQSSIWIPSQVINEYLENKSVVIADAHKKFENVSKDVQKIIKDADSDITMKFHRYGKFKFPNINRFRNDISENIGELLEKVEAFKEIVTNEIQENKVNLIEDDVNLFIESLNKLTQVGKPLSFHDSLKLYEEGALRYNHLIPPGYMDASKDKKDTTKLKKFGDLIIWKEILLMVSKEKRKVIFITDDEKEDWWEIKTKNTPNGIKETLIGPRKELLSEFKDYYNEDFSFLMLTLPEFNKHISKVIRETNYKEAYLNDIELNPSKIVEELIKSKDWSLILNNSNNLTHSLLNDGEFQELINEILIDVEISDYFDPSFEDLYVDYEDSSETSKISIEGRFKCKIEVNIETALSKEYHETKEYFLYLSGNISLEFEYFYDEEHDLYKSFNEQISVDNTEIFNYEDLSFGKDYSEIECTVCKIASGAHFTNEGEQVCRECVTHFDICTKCGVLYPHNSLGGQFCNNCED